VPKTERRPACSHCRQRWGRTKNQEKQKNEVTGLIGQGEGGGGCGGGGHKNNPMGEDLLKPTATVRGRGEHHPFLAKQSVKSHIRVKRKNSTRITPIKTGIFQRGGEKFILLKKGPLFETPHRKLRRGPSEVKSVAESCSPMPGKKKQIWVPTKMKKRGKGHSRHCHLG